MDPEEDWWWSDSETECDDYEEAVGTDNYDEEDTDFDFEIIEDDDFVDPAQFD